MAPRSEFALPLPPSFHPPAFRRKRCFFLLAPMASTLEHTTPDRLRKVLLCRDDPPWPYPTEEEALALVAMLARVAPDPGMAATRVRTLQRRTGLTWSVVAPRQWEHFRAVSQYVLRWLSAKNPVGPIEEVSLSLTLLTMGVHIISSVT